MSLCLSCSSPTLASIPTSSNPRIFLTPCCSSPICNSCLYSNPRLRTYVPCLKCGDGVAVSKAKARVKVRTGSTRITEDECGEGDARDGDERFTLGGDSVDEDDSDGGDLIDLRTSAQRAVEDIITPSSPPPEYTLDRTLADRRSTSPATSSSPPSGSPSTRTARSPGRDPISFNEARVEVAHEGGGNSIAGTGKVVVVDQQRDEGRHLVRKGDTVRGLAGRYGIDPHDILEYNDLPHTCLSTNPNLIQTRRYIFLRSPTHINPRANHSNSTRSTDDSESQTTTASEPTEEELRTARERERARVKERRLKRFQLVTKEVDRAVARTYLALEEDGSGDDVEEGVEHVSRAEDKNRGDGRGTGPKYRSDREKPFDTRAQLDEKTEKLGSSSVRGVVVGKEDSAVNRFFEDEAWEQAQSCHLSGAVNGIFASSAGSTGQGSGQTAAGLLSAIGSKLGPGKGKSKDSPGSGFKPGRILPGAPFLGSNGVGRMARKEARGEIFVGGGVRAKEGGRGW